MEIKETTVKRTQFITVDKPWFVAEHEVYGVIGNESKEELEEILGILSKIKEEWVIIEIPKDTLLSIREMDLGITIKEYQQVRHLLNPYNKKPGNKSKVPNFYYDSSKVKQDTKIVIQEIIPTGVGELDEIPTEYGEEIIKSIVRLKH